LACDLSDRSHPARNAGDSDSAHGDSHADPSGLRERFDKHRAIARWTWPLWMYVSVTGVLVYFMLYQWFPHS
jgi:hypothetical protein